jgi:hypothetical protein
VPDASTAQTRALPAATAAADQPAGNETQPEMSQAKPGTP